MAGVSQEREVHHGRDLGQQADSGLSQRCQRREHSRVETLGWPGRGGWLQPGLAGTGEIIRRKCPDVLPVKRPQLLDVEERRRRVHVLQPELLDDRGPGDDLAVAARRPAQEHEVVAHRLGQVALVAEVLDRHVGVPPLGQLLPLLVHQDRQVRPGGRLLAQGHPQQLLLRRVGQVLLGPGHQADPLAHVIDHVGQQEQHRPVRADEDKVLQGGVLERRLAPHQVVHHRGALVRGAEPHGPALPGPEAPVPAEPVVAPVLITGPGHDRVAGAVAVVGQPGVVQSLRGRLVPGQVVRLEVGTLVLVGRHPQPGQGRDDALGPFRPVARCVGVLDAQHQHAARLPGHHPVDQCRPRAADVQIAGRGRREPDPHPAGRVRPRGA